MYRTVLLLLLAAVTAPAGPYIPAGDLALRHDIQRLADQGCSVRTVLKWILGEAHRERFEIWRFPDLDPLRYLLRS